MKAPTPGRKPHSAATVQAMVDAQRVAIRHPNPRVAIALGHRIGRALEQGIDQTDTAGVIGLHDSLHAVAGLVQAELDRLKMELVHMMGSETTPPPRTRTLDRIAG